MEFSRLIRYVFTIWGLQGWKQLLEYGDTFVHDYMFEWKLDAVRNSRYLLLQSST